MIQLRFEQPCDGDWAACRMLLPDTVADSALREFWFAIDTLDGALSGAAAFIDTGEALTAMDLHIVKDRRGKGAGKQLLRHVVTTAMELGRSEVSALLNTNKNPALSGFLKGNGFTLRRQFFVAEGDLVEIYRAQCKRCARVANISEGIDWQIVPLSPEMLGEAGRLYAEYLAELSSDDSTGYFIAPHMAGLGLSQVLLHDGKIEGMLLANRASDCVTFDARVVRPALRNTRASAALLMRALEASVATRASRLRFNYSSAVPDTSAVVRRLKMQVVDTKEHLALRLNDRA